MKKRVFAIFLAAVLTLSLCGCDALDEMRQRQIFLNEDTVTYQGVTYRRLPPCDELQPKTDTDTTLYVTAQDVPVLLTTVLYEDSLNPSLDGDFLWGDSIYCREDRHEEILKTIQEGFTPTKMRYTYYTFDEDTYEDTMQEYVLTTEQIKALETVTANVTPQKLGEGISLSRDFTLWLEECSEDLLFCRDSMQLAASGSTYYLILEVNQETLAFPVPAGMNDTFDTITEAYRSAFLLPESEQYT